MSKEKNYAVVIASRKDLEDTMNELLRTSAEIGELEAEGNKLIADTRDHIVEKTSELEKKQAALKGSIVAFAKAHLGDEEFFPNGGKTITLRSGSISVKKTPDAIVIAEGFTEEEVLKRAEKQGVDGIIRNPEPELDKNAVMAKLKAEELDPKLLKKLGLEIKSDETISITLKAVTSKK